MDVQECPAADIAVLELVIETIKALVNGKFIDHDAQMKYKTDALVQLFDLGIERAEEAVISDKMYLRIFGVDTAIKAGDLWKYILESLIRRGNTALERWQPELNIILTEGSLATRMVKALNGNHSMLAMNRVYRQLSDCLAQDKLFLP